MITYQKHYSGDEYYYRDISLFNFSIVPHTYENTNLKFIKNGDYVNIEVDIVAKYVEKFLSSSDNKSRISLEFLQEHGF